MERLGKQNVEVIFADGLAVPATAGLFDRILIHARLNEVPPDLVALLAGDGRIVLARPDREVAWRQVLVELRRDAAGTLVETQIAACRLQALLPGIAQVL